MIIIIGTTHESYFDRVYLQGTAFLENTWGSRACIVVGTGI